MPEAVPSLLHSHCAMHETAITQEHAQACASPPAERSLQQDSGGSLGEVMLEMDLEGKAERS